jgi:hypothetical protein
VSRIGRSEVVPFDSRELNQFGVGVGCISPFHLK